MKFIKSVDTPQETIIETPPMPALQAIFYWLAFLVIFSIVAIWKFFTCPPGMDTGTFFAAQLACSMLCLFTSLIFFGIGQAIGYLGQTAFYARQLFEIVQTRSDNL